MNAAPEPVEHPALAQALRSSPVKTVSVRQALGFALGDFYGGGQLTLIPTYLAVFWTRFCHMDIATAQGIIGMSAVLSSVGALVFGVFDDNLYRFKVGRRFGRRRFMLMIIAPLILLGTLMWIPGQPVAAYAASYIVWVLLAQLFQASYNPLPGEMTQDYTGRTLLSTLRMMVSTSAATIIPLIGALTLSVMGERSARSYMIFTISITVIFAVCVAITWHSTWEITPVQAGFGPYARGEVSDRGLGVGVWLARCGKVVGEYASTLRIAVFRSHLSIYLLVQVSMDVFGQLFIFFVLYDWNQTAAFGSLLLGFSAVAIPLMPLFGWLLKRIGPRRLYALNFAGNLLGLAWLFMAWMLVDAWPHGLWSVFTVVGALWFFVFKSLCGYLPWAVFPDIADVDQLITGRYRAGTFSGIQAALRQLCSGIVTMLIGLVLALMGFNPAHEPQSEGVQIGLAAILLGWTSVSMIVCWIVSSHFRLDEHADHVILAEITRLRNGGSKADVRPEVRHTAEQLTGLSYDEMWNNGQRGQR